MTVNYGERTAQEVLEEMLEGARDDVDKREGAVVHDMLAPPAEQIEMLGWELDAIYDNGFADTADLDFLIRRAAELGVDWKDAVKATGVIRMEGANGAVIPVGYRIFTEDRVYFETIADATLLAGAADIPAQAVVGGLSGNVLAGAVSYFENTGAGITKITNVSAFSGGLEAETADDLLARYLLKVRKPITSGNTYHYEKWATDIDGVAAAKVFPLWAGNGTVKVVIIASNGRAPAAEVITAVTNHIEIERPIGATVTVVPVTEIAVNIGATLTLAGDLLPADILAAVKASIGAYLLASASTGLVRYARIGEALLDTEGVLDYENLTLNGATANVPIAEDAVAVPGEVTLV